MSPVCLNVMTLFYSSTPKINLPEQLSPSRRWFQLSAWLIYGSVSWSYESRIYAQPFHENQFCLARQDDAIRK
ncbi:hypothetical protein J6590_031665 [Homalodisca vitripennis]|nr:hypothetical protein J6590_031665 [Homalodisca vitripennis]